MTAPTRDAIFISHANPEDNAFTVWLGSRLTAAGYEVWADVLRLRGGQDWQRLLEDAHSATRHARSCLSARNMAYRSKVSGTRFRLPTR